MMTSLVFASSLLATSSPMVGAGHAPTLDADAVTASVGDLVAEQASSKPEAPRVVEVADGGEDKLFTVWLPYLPPEDLDPRVDEKFVLLYLVGALAGFFLGHLWIGPAIVGESLSHPDATTDAIISWIIHVAIQVAGSALFYFGGFLVLGANWAYLLPISIIAHYNHYLKAGGGRGKSKRRRRKSAEALIERPGLAALEAAPQMAF